MIFYCYPNKRRSDSSIGLQSVLNLKQKNFNRFNAYFIFFLISKTIIS